VYSSTALQRSKRNNKINQSGYDGASLKLVATHFGGRLLGTTTCWLFNDFLFYGNKLFSSTFIKIIDPNAASNVITTWNWNLLNVGVEMFGYYMAALLIDHKFYGRKRMQIFGFLADGILFLIPASELRLVSSQPQVLTRISLVHAARVQVSMLFVSQLHPLLICWQNSHQGFPSHLLPVFLLPAVWPEVSGPIIPLIGD